MTFSSFHFVVIKTLPIDKQTKRFGHNWYYYWRETHIHTELMNINVSFEHVNVGFHRSLPTLAEPCRTLTRSSRCVMTVSQLPMSCHCQQSKLHAAHHILNFIRHLCADRSTIVVPKPNMDIRFGVIMKVLFTFESSWFGLWPVACHLPLKTKSSR